MAPRHSPPTGLAGPETCAGLGDVTVLNNVAVLLAAFASFAFGAAWYGTLAKPWLAAGSRANGPQPVAARLGPIPVAYLLALLAELVMAWMVAGILLHTHGSDHRGFPVAWVRRHHARAVNHAFQGAKFTLTLIDGGHCLGVLLLQGTILGA
jgi:hypothetical protein